MTQNVAVIATDRLTKRYGERVVVDELTVEVPEGSVVGFIGPNGAGKTTTMAMLLGLVRPTAGDATVLDEPVRNPARYLHRVGALLEGPALWPGLTGAENLRAMARLAGHDESRIPEILDIVGLSDRADDRFRGYSLGMKQRLGVAAALLGDPELLVLDEPTNGLDPVGITEMRALIGRIAAEERTVLVSSHLLGELEQVCDWLIIIDQGKLIYAGDSAGFGTGTADTIMLAPLDPGHLTVLADVVTTEGLEPRPDGDGLLVTVEGRKPRELAAELNYAALMSGIVLAELEVRRPTLESSYLSILEGENA
ncbi:ABC transporter ATP-binding protein [Phytoactinopolyspora endophytica]|uniref:ABC transporter ATP-binding protein n=1 Tax=Phytoactinopolyspora endophytica TaxID=1642495 RepID=UPI00101C84DD|nr:ABC transporter ATP-binding protein [Phytoactinopolyspora endophytica]